MMKKVDYMEFYNDPGIINEPTPLREVHAIRLAIHEETKGMTCEERLDRLRKNTDPIIKKYGFKLVNSVNEA